MRDEARLWWCNADFDLTLAHGGGKMPAKILQAARAMPWHLWPALAPRDTLAVPHAPPEGFRDYLEGLGLEPPRFRATPFGPADDGALFTPFGWNAAAAGINAGRARPAAHPDLEVVRRVNSRAFSLELERELFGEDACPAAFCAGSDAVNAWMASALPGRYVAKGNQGLAGIGQSRFAFAGRARDPRGSLAARLRRLAARHGGVVFEREQDVVREWALLFLLRRDGTLSGFRRHRLLSTPYGGYAGALIVPGEEPEWEAHRERAEVGARRVARALHREGYFGPVGIDLYAHHVEGRECLRSLVDLNARLSMAWPAHGLAARFPDRTVLLHQLPAASIRAPRDYKSLQLHHDILSFDSRARRGVIWLTPLLPLPRHSVAFMGDDETDVMTLQRNVLREFAA